jgi:hypothetical protein
MDEFKKMNPKIISVVDLTHLQPQERTHIIGSENLKSRREFLLKLLKAGVVVGLPVLLFPGCKPDIIYQPTQEEDCPAYTPCAQNIACACQTDTSASVPPIVVNTVPVKNSSFSLDPNGVEIRIDLNKAMDSTSITGALTLTPEPSGGYDIHFYDLSKSQSGIKTSLSLVKKNSKDKLQLVADTLYTVTLKGTARDTNGKYLDGNGDGTAGDDFTYTFTTIKKYDSCICQADCTCQSYVACSCQSYVSCSCQSYSSCSCQSNVCFYCSCQYAGCTLYRV